VQAHRDGCPDEQDREAEGLDQLQAVADRSERSAWDAWDGARRGEAADAPLRLLALLAAGDAGKSADPERVVLARDASFPRELLLGQLGPAEQDAVAGPYRLGAAPSGEQSCAAPVFAARRQPPERLDAAYSVLQEQQAMPSPSSRVLQAQAELPQLQAALRDEPVAQLLPVPQVVQAAQWEPQAFQLPAAQSQDGRQERASAEQKPELAVQAELLEQQASLPEPRLSTSAERPAARGAATQAQRQLPSSA